MKAIALISGGLDSILAARTIQEQGIDVLPLNFYIPFFSRPKEKPRQNIISFVKNTLGKELKIIDISKDFLKILENPVYGYGANMNPCIDCKILMLTKAKELMHSFGCAFIVTGEVLGQRPMSQHRQALELIEKKSGLSEYLLRPLSAQHLTETLPEKKGWVDRKKLLNISGRSRRPQIKLAEFFKFKDYPNAAGGCLLTDAEFVKRLKDIINNNDLDVRNIELLKFGRHFRFSQSAKLIVGRDERENEQLLNLAKAHDYIFMPKDAAGPTCLGVGDFNEELIHLSCAIACRYCDRNGNVNINITYRKFSDKEDNCLGLSPVKESAIMKYRI